MQRTNPPRLNRARFFYRLLLAGIVTVQLCMIVWCTRAIMLALHKKANPVVSYAAALSLLDYKQSPTDRLSYFYEILPGRIVEEKPPWGGAPVSHRINNQGQNDPFDHPVIKPPGTYRILALGDSFIFGQYVPAEKNYPSRILAAIRAYMTCGLTPEMINMGVPGYDIQYAVQHYIIHGKQYQPDLIVWLLKDDDFDDIQELTWMMKGRVEDEASASGRTEEYREKYGVFFPEVIAVEKLRSMYSEREILAFQRSYLDALSREYKGKLLIVTYKSMKNEYKQVLAEFAGARPLTWIADILTYKHTSDWRFPDGHPTAVGYEQMALATAAYLRTSALDPCRDNR